MLIIEIALGITLGYGLIALGKWLWAFTFLDLHLFRYALLIGVCWVLGHWTGPVVDHWVSYYFPILTYNQRGYLLGGVWLLGYFPYMWLARRWDTLPAEQRNLQGGLTAVGRKAADAVSKAIARCDFLLTDLRLHVRDNPSFIRLDRLAGKLLSRLDPKPAQSSVYGLVPDDEPAVAWTSAQREALARGRKLAFAYEAATAALEEHRRRMADLPKLEVSE